MGLGNSLGSIIFGIPRRMEMSDEIVFRVATLNDAKALLDIYAYYVKNTSITFEYDAPSLEEFSHRIQTTLKVTSKN